jgi:hypothetical protein
MMLLKGLEKQQHFSVMSASCRGSESQSRDPTPHSLSLLCPIKIRPSGSDASGSPFCEEILVASFAILASGVATHDACQQSTEGENQELTKMTQDIVILQIRNSIHLLQSMQPYTLFYM